MSADPLVSIIVNNHNYARFLREAVDSALGQSYQPVQVIVVDDGSTDGSRAIIESYGARVVPVFKANGGQASTFNAGFAQSRGDIVLFLDADDRLRPDLVARVVAEFQRDPTLAKVQYRLAVMDAAGRPTGAVKPNAHLPMVSGDLRQRVLACFDETTWQSTSGNAFAAAVLRQIMPVPETVFPRTGADYYLANLPPLFGPVRSLDGIGADFRIHGTNNHHTSRMSLERTREIIRRTYRVHELIQERGSALGINPNPLPAREVLGVRFLAHRMASLKLDPAHHPVADDTVVWLARRGIRAALRRTDLPWRTRLVYIAWFLAIAPAPRRAAHWLAERFFYPETRRPLARLLRPGRRVFGSLRLPLKARR